MIRQNVDFRENEQVVRFVPLTIFHLNFILLLLMKMNVSQYFSHLLKLEQRIDFPLFFLSIIRMYIKLNKPLFFFFTKFMI